jgi:hypothetical protein
LLIAFGVGKAICIGAGFSCWGVGAFHRFNFLRLVLLGRWGVSELILKAVGGGFDLTIFYTRKMLMLIIKEL